MEPRRAGRRGGLREDGPEHGLGTLARQQGTGPAGRAAGGVRGAVDEHGSPLFLLKGGTLLQYRRPGQSRTTKDIDGLVRGDLDQFLEQLDRVLTEPWGPLTLVRGEVEVIEVPGAFELPLAAKKLAKSQILEIRQRVFCRKMVRIERLDCGAIFAVDSVLFDSGCIC